ncbi:Upstream of flc like [Thalictrum thalictroides]|uniref:Upstream of flc like n=1 Tax=Thalictrum thalictroides TaxID=46969 RepID=A0A7J6WG25_THATH|nr:Upstream of flc like [Thalictrum thalictroides]
MEGKGEVCVDHEKGGGGGGGEVRRIHIIYFLSRMGRIEHPHLIRVHHLSRNGIHLRDVKRWLTELRGKNMPDSFSWSYKRRYKSGYIWQDLMDDDLITPISDNEFVLKGSEIPTISIDSCTCGKKIVRNEGKPEQGPMKVSTDQAPSSHTSSTKTSQTDEDSGPLYSETSPSTEESFKTSAVFTPDASNFTKTHTTTEIEEVEEKCYLNIEEEVKKVKEESKFNRKKSKSYSNKSSNVFRNLLNCGAVETNDSAMMMVAKNGSYSPLNNNSAEICRYEPFGGSERIFSSAAWNQQQAHYARASFSGGKSLKKTNDFANQKNISAAYKPVREPHCSQCGKAFKPEKFPTHMKYCKGLKSFGKNRADVAADTTEKMSSDDISTETLLRKQHKVTY